MVGDGLQSPETESGGSDDGFFPLKPASIDPTGALTKFGEIRISRQVFGQNTLDFYEIWGDVTKSREISARSSGNLTGSSEISPDPVRSPSALAHFGLKSTILAGFFTVDGFDRTDCVSGEKIDRSDLTLSPVGGRSERSPPEFGESVSGWAQTRPGLTRGHPYQS